MSLRRERADANLLARRTGAQGRRDRRDLIEGAMLEDAGLMLKLFDTITIGGVLATVVEVHNEHAFEIEFHDGREDRVVTLDLRPKLAGTEELHA